MTATALQNVLIKEISKIKNLNTLQDIQAFIQTQEPQNTLSAVQKELIQLGIDEIETGNGISHQDFMKELDEKYGAI
jgi:hypothetical protein